MYKPQKTPISILQQDQNKKSQEGGLLIKSSQNLVHFWKESSEFIC